MPLISSLKAQITQKLQLLAGAPQVEDLLTPEAKERILAKGEKLPEVPKRFKFFGGDVLSPEERFTQVNISPFRSIIRAPGKIGQIQEKVFRFLAPQTGEEEAIDVALGFSGAAGAIKKTTGRVLRKASEKGIKLAEGLGEEIIKKGERGAFELAKTIPKGFQPLAQEARKYKSAEEFVKGQTTYYHGTTENFDTFKLQGSRNLGPDAIFVSPQRGVADYYAQGIGKDGVSQVKEAYVMGGKIFDYRNPKDVDSLWSSLNKKTKNEIMGFETTDYVSMEGIKSDIAKGRYDILEKPVVQDAIKKLGYDGFQIRDYTGGDAIGILNPDILKTKSQLTDFYNQVTKRVSKIIPKAIEPLPGNLQRLNVAPEVKQNLQNTIEQIKPELEAIRGGVLKNVEVVEAAQASDILRRVVTKESTLKSEAAILRTRQHLAELAKNEKVTPEFIDALRVVNSEATKRGRELQALGIEADPALGTIKTKIVKQLLDIGESTDDILKAAEGVDFTNAKQVTDFYRKFVKPSLAELIDEYRYINLLSSPKTHIVNAFSNLMQVSFLRPTTRLASGVVDTIASELTGKEQQFYVKQVPAYYKGAFNAWGEASKGFLNALRGQTLIYRPDVSRIPTGSKLLRPFQVIPRILEGADVFFRTLANAGEAEALMSKGVTKAEAILQAAKTGEELVFRKALDPSNKTGQGALLSGIDKMTSAVYKLRNAPGFKWFIPFVQTPMNILKQGIEYSPLGLATLPRNVNKIEQLGKSMVGSMVFTGAGWLALKNRTTWAVPTSQKEKSAFYAAGMQPYAVRIGNNWVSYSRLGPLAYPIAMAAAIRFYTEQNPKAISDTDLQKTSKVILGIAKFFSDQSYMEGLGDFVNLAEGDVSAATRTIANIPSQLIPLASLQRWVANLIDPIYRKTESQLSLESIIKNLEKGIPFLSKNLEPFTTPFGQPSKRQFPALQALSPIGVTEEKKSEKSLFELLRQKRKVENLKKSIKEKLKEKIQEQINLQKVQ